jgi:hypothetical protein
VQACQDGNASYCDGLLRTFEREMRRLDVGQVIPIRPENARQAIGQWIRTGQVML